MSKYEHLKQKSEYSLNAAKLLYEHGKETGAYSSVPHCAYYSCFQLMTCIIGETGNSHFTTIKKIEKHIEENIGLSQDSEDFINKIYNLKDYREKADYKNEEITQKISSGAINKAERIREILERSNKN